MSSIKVRSYVPGDHSPLVRLWSRVFRDDPPRNAPDAMIRNKERVQPELLLVATLEKTIVGAVIAGFDGTRGWIYHLAVDSEFRRMGIGTALVRAAEEGLRRLGCPEVNLRVRAGNEAVVAFYQSLDFEVEPRVSLGKAVGANRAHAMRVASDTMSALYVPLSAEVLEVVGYKSLSDASEASRQQYGDGGAAKDLFDALRRPPGGERGHRRVQVLKRAPSSAVYRVAHLARDVCSWV